MLWLLLACGSPEPDTTPSTADTATADTGSAALCADQPPISWEDFGEGFFTTWCQACHSATTTERNGAPTALNFDTVADIRQHRALIDRTVLDEGSMPVGGGLSETELLMVELFLWCGL